MEYIEIEKDLIPYRFDVELANETFTFEVHYNPDYDFFTVDLERAGAVLVQGEKMVYGMPLFYDVQDNQFPRVPVVPFDLSDKESVVNWRTLNESVFLYVVVENGT